MLELKLEDEQWSIVGEAWGKPFRINTGLREDQKDVAEFARLGVEREAEEGFRGRKRPVVILGNKSVKEAIRSYLAKRLQETGHQMHGSTLRRYSMLERDFGHLPLHAITQELLDEWIDRRMANDGLKPQSVRTLLMPLMSVLKYGEQVGWIAGRNTIRLPQEYVYRDEHFSMPEIKRFLEVCIQTHPAYFPTFLFMIDTGARRGEMMAAEWADVNLDAETVLLRKRRGRSKTRTRTVPLSPRLKRTLEALPWRDGSLLRSAFGKSWVEADMQHAIGPVLADIVARAGIATDKHRRITLHTLRHTFAFQCASYGMDLADISYLLGHSKVETTMIYRGFVPDIGVATVAKFGAAVSGKHVPERAIVERAVRETLEQLKEAL